MGSIRKLPARMLPSRTGGFTLIELLIVMGIIGLLVALLVPAIGKAKQQSRKANAKHDISSFEAAIQHFHHDHSVYPGYGGKPVMDENKFPAMYEALLGERQPRGGGGQNAPYMERLEAERVRIFDEYADDPLKQYSVADRDSLEDKNVQKFFMDPWGLPYFYRENESKPSKENWMINKNKYDLWSFGPDETDQSMDNEFDRTEGKDASGNEYDDIGNW